MTTIMTTTAAAAATRCRDGTEARAGGDRLARGRTFDAGAERGLRRPPLPGPPRLPPEGREAGERRPGVPTRRRRPANPRTVLSRRPLGAAYSDRSGFQTNADLSFYTSTNKRRFSRAQLLRRDPRRRVIEEVEKEIEVVFLRPKQPHQGRAKANTPIFTPHYQRKLPSSISNLSPNFRARKNAHYFCSIRGAKFRGSKFEG